MAKFDYLLINKKTLLILKSLVKPKTTAILLNIVGGSSNTLKTYTDRLVEEGYISENRMLVFPYKRTLSLTKKGLKTLRQMEKIE